MQTAIHHTTLTGDGAPEWVHLLPAGTFRGVDGRGPYTLADAQAVIDASMTSQRLAIDVNHSTDIAAPKGGESPARGWIVAMEVRADGIWGRVEWTDPGAAMVAGKEYRGLSPVFLHDKGGRVLRIMRAALTNTPNLTLTSLNNQETKRMDPVQFRAALGLPETADDAAILAAVQQNAQAIAAHASQIAAIARAAGLGEATAPDGLVTALQARQAEGGEIARMAATITGLETQLRTMQSQQAQAAAVAFIDGAIAAGKPINALREHYITRHMGDAATVETEINALVSINAGGMGQPTGSSGAGGGGGAVQLTADDEQVIAAMSLDRDAYLKTKQAQISLHDRRAV